MKVRIEFHHRQDDICFERDPHTVVLHSEEGVAVLPGAKLSTLRGCWHIAGVAVEEFISHTNEPVDEDCGQTVADPLDMEKTNG